MIVSEPIDKMIEKETKQDGSRYTLVSGIALRARKIAQQDKNTLTSAENKPISVASKEYWESKFKIIKK